MHTLTCHYSLHERATASLACCWLNKHMPQAPGPGGLRLLLSSASCWDTIDLLAMLSRPAWAGRYPALQGAVLVVGPPPRAGRCKACRKSDALQRIQCQPIQGRRSRLAGPLAGHRACNEIGGRCKVPQRRLVPAHRGPAPQEGRSPSRHMLHASPARLQHAAACAGRVPVLLAAVHGAAGWPAPASAPAQQRHRGALFVGAAWGARPEAGVVVWRAWSHEVRADVRALVDDSSLHRELPLCGIEQVDGRAGAPCADSPADPRTACSAPARSLSVSTQDMRQHAAGLGAHLDMGRPGLICEAHGQRRAGVSHWGRR